MDEFRRGKVVPFLGAGASGSNLGHCVRGGLPTGFELAQEIASDAEFPADDERDYGDLPKVASYYVDKINRDALRSKLRAVFTRPGLDFNEVHRLLAEIADDNLFTITTNYDVMLENAFRRVGKSFDVIVYPADNREYANSVLRWHDGASEPERLKSNELDVADLEKRNVIYKMHGSVHASIERWDSFVITEEDYVDFLAKSKNAIPGAVKEFLSKREFLFLGYGLRDWNTRVLLRQVSKADRRSWAIQRNPSIFEQTLWNRRNVDIYAMELDEFVTALRTKGGLEEEIKK